MNQDLFAHVIGDMRLAVSRGDLAEPSLGLVVGWWLSWLKNDLMRGVAGNGNCLVTVKVVLVQTVYNSHT